GGTIVGHSGLVGRYQPAVGRRFLRGIRNRTALFIDSKRPVYRAERNRQEVLPVGAVVYKKVAVARTLYQHLSRLAVELSVDQHWSLDGIQIVRIVRRRLERPDQFAGIAVQGDDAACVEVLARPRR